MIAQRGRIFVVLNADGTRRLGAHATRAEAEAQERAIAHATKAQADAVKEPRGHA